MFDRTFPAGAPEQPAASATRCLGLLLDTVDYGLLVMESPPRVAVANRAAYATFDDAYPLRLVDGEVVARREVEQQAFDDAVHAAQHRGLRKLLRLGSGTASVFIAVVPLPGLRSDGGNGVSLLMGRRALSEALSVDAYARVNHLTMAETAVLRGLCEDLTPQAIADRQGVGLATVRTQIGCIRNKTGAGSIRALVRQVSLLPPVVSALGSGQALLPARPVATPPLPAGPSPVRVPQPVLRPAMPAASAHALATPAHAQHVPAAPAHAQHMPAARPALGPLLPVTRFALQPRPAAPRPRLVDAVSVG